MSSVIIHRRHTKQNKKNRVIKEFWEEKNVKTIQTKSNASKKATVIMALALKKDVQKASYYVFFLGAQEARELRGERVLLSTLPHIISRSRQQEPLKVTLQISQKGIKIIQVSARISAIYQRCRICRIFTQTKYLLSFFLRNFYHFQFSTYCWVSLASHLLEIYGYM